MPRKLTKNTTITRSMEFMTGYGEWAPFTGCLGKTIADAYPAYDWFCGEDGNVFQLFVRRNGGPVYIFTRQEIE